MKKETKNKLQYMGTFVLIAALVIISSSLIYLKNSAIDKLNQEKQTNEQLSSYLEIKFEEVENQESEIVSLYDKLSEARRLSKIVEERDRKKYNESIDRLDIRLENCLRSKKILREKIKELDPSSKFKKIERNMVGILPDQYTPTTTKKNTTVNSLDTTESGARYIQKALHVKR